MKYIEYIMLLFEQFSNSLAFIEGEFFCFYQQK